MANQYAPWSDMELNQLKEMAGHFPASHIASQIGRGKDGVLKKIRELKLPGYVSLPPKPRPVAQRKPVERKEYPQHVARPVVAPVKPVTVRKASVQNNVSYPPLEYCHVHHCLVSNWSDHSSRLGGCQRPAA